MARVSIQEDTQNHACNAEAAAENCDDQGLIHVRSVILRWTQPEGVDQLFRVPLERGGTLQAAPVARQLAPFAGLYLLSRREPRNRGRFHVQPRGAAHDRDRPTTRIGREQPDQVRKRMVAAI